jgi:hypothetical protein
MDGWATVAWRHQHDHALKVSFDARFVASQVAALQREQTVQNVHRRLQL